MLEVLVFHHLHQYIALYYRLKFTWRDDFDFDCGFPSSLKSIDQKTTCYKMYNCSVQLCVQSTIVSTIACFVARIGCFF